MNAAQERADQLVKDFYARSGPQCWPHLDRSELTGGLQWRIRNPTAINQGPMGVCGVATVVEQWAADDPVNYVWLAISLFEQGVGYFGANPQSGRTIRPSAALKQAAIPKNMNQADWLILASLRESFHKWGDAISYRGKTIVETLYGTPPSMVESAFRSIGYSHIDNHSDMGSTQSINNALDAGTYVGTGRRVAMFVNANMLAKGTEHKKGRGGFLGLFSVCDHVVGLMSDIYLDVTDPSGQSVLPFYVFTWGTRQRVPEDPAEGSLPLGDFLDNYYGYMVAKF